MGSMVKKLKEKHGKLERIKLGYGLILARIVDDDMNFDETVRLAEKNLDRLFKPYWALEIWFKKEAINRCLPVNVGLSGENGRVPFVGVLSKTEPCIELNIIVPAFQWIGQEAEKFRNGSGFLPVRTRCGGQKFVCIYNESDLERFIKTSLAAGEKVDQ